MECPAGKRNLLTTANASSSCCIDTSLEAAEQRLLRLLIFIVAYNAERTIEWVLSRIPSSLAKYETEILIIDDASADDTCARAKAFRELTDFPFPIKVLANPLNQGYGGNQKLGFLYAIQENFDIVALVHGDGQYAPEALPDLVAPIAEKRADAVFGSRMISAFGALKGGMPLYKYVGNRILTTYQNLMLGSKLSEFHSGYRIYSVNALKSIPFRYNTHDFHFDTQIIIQLMFARRIILELPIPTYYGDEICRVNGLKYAWDVAAETFVARLQRFSLLYRKYFDIQPEDACHYESKIGFDSSHSAALNKVPHGSTVVDIGCASGIMGKALAAKGCQLIGIDKYPTRNSSSYKQIVLHDLNETPLPVNLKQADYVLLLDVIEHLNEPEKFVESLRETARTGSKFIVSTGNIAFFIPRLMLLIGQFNYGKRGILDLTHTRLFTFESIERLLKENGFKIHSTEGLPAPFPLAFGNSKLADLLVWLNRKMIAISRGLFSYQIMIVAEPLPTLEQLLSATKKHSQTLQLSVIEEVEKTAVALR